MSLFVSFSSYSSSKAGAKDSLQIDLELRSGRKKGLCLYSILQKNTYIQIIYEFFYTYIYAYKCEDIYMYNICCGYSTHN